MQRRGRRGGCPRAEEEEDRTEEEEEDEDRTEGEEEERCLRMHEGDSGREGDEKTGGGHDSRHDIHTCKRSSNQNKIKKECRIECMVLQKMN